MPVDSKHPQYSKAAPRWQKMRDVLDGEEAIKEGGKMYLPALEEQTPNDYEAYKTRAQFFNATQRSVQTFEGFIFRKDPVTTAPPVLDDFLADATLSGVSFLEYTKETTREILGVGRRGTYVDWSAEESRPYCTPYAAEQVINWRTERVNGVSVLTMLVLFEKSGAFYAETGDDAPDEYEGKEWDQWREFRLERGEGGQRFCICRVYRRKKADSAEFVIVDTIVPTRRGIGLPLIPFVFHNTRNASEEVGHIPLYDMALVNIALYRTSADLENGRHICGLPTPWAAGFTWKEGQKFLLGAGVGYTSDNVNAKMGFLEFTGQGLDCLKAAADEKKSEMAALGAKMLEPEAKKAEAYETVASRQAAETSALMSVTITNSETLSNVLQLALWWMGTADDPEEFGKVALTELNTEFTVGRLPADQLQAYFNAYLSGAISDTVLFYNLKQGEALPPDYTLEEMQNDIATRPPAMLTLGAGDGTGGGGGGGAGA